MSNLREAINEYIEMRRKLGYKLVQAGYLLDFATFMEKQNAPFITTVLAVKWVQSSASAQPVTWYNRMTILRGFARYHFAIDSRTEIPGRKILPHMPKRATPHLFTASEIERLLQAALDLQRVTSFKRRTYYCVLGLLFVSGMRISEVLGLKMANVDLQDSVITVEGAKTGKYRIIPLHESTRKVLLNYKLHRAKVLRGNNADHFFVSDDGAKLNVDAVRSMFYSLLRRTGLKERIKRKGPRLHDARHQFAIETLLFWYRNKENLEIVLPTLATFLGHTNINDTYWYLSACPELMDSAVQRLEEHWKEARL